MLSFGAILPHTDRTLEDFSPQVSTGPESGWDVGFLLMVPQHPTAPRIGSEFGPDHKGHRKGISKKVHNTAHAETDELL